MKSRSSALPDLDCPPISKHPLIPALIACVAALELLLSSGEPDGPVCHSGMSDFPNLEHSCLAGGRCSHNGHLLCSSLRGQNPQQVLTMSGGSALAAESTDCTTLPKVDKADTSPAEGPMT
jgi:hypothetical protein